MNWLLIVQSIFITFYHQSLNFREITRPTIERHSEDHLRQMRATPCDQPSRSWLVDPLGSTWGGGVTRGDYVEAMSKMRIGETPDPQHDVRVSRAFYARFKEDDTILFPKLAPNQAMLPGSSSILDQLKKIASQPGTWKIPTESELGKMVSHRQLTDAALNNVDCRQFDLQTGDADRLDSLIDWAMEKLEESERQMPIGVVPCAVAALQVKHEDYNQICAPKFRGKDVNVQSDLSNYEGEKEWLPIKIVVGNGVDWCLVFEYSISEMTDDTYTIKNVALPPAFVSFMKKLPAITGFHAPTSAVELEDWLQRSTGDPEVRVSAAVDLPCLARLAGWKCNGTESTTMALITTGMGYFRFYKWTEPFWTRPFHLINREFHKDIIGYIKVIYTAYRTLLYTLLYDTLPDADIIMNITRKTSEEFADFWSTFIVYVLNYTMVDKQEARNAATRQQLCNSIKVMLFNGEMGETPFRVKLFSQLIGPWPTLTKGGPRFLQIVREQFLIQHGILKSLPLPKFEDFFDQEIRPAHRYYARFGLEIELITSLRQGTPITDSRASLHLVQHPILQRAAIKLDMRRLSYKTLADKAPDSG